MNIKTLPNIMRDSHETEVNTKKHPKKVPVSRIEPKIVNHQTINDGSQFTLNRSKSYGNQKTQSTRTSLLDILFNKKRVQKIQITKMGVFNKKESSREKKIV